MGKLQACQPKIFCIWLLQGVCFFAKFHWHTTVSPNVALKTLLTSWIVHKFAYMDFTDSESLRKALELHESELDGYQLSADEAKPRDSQSSGGRGGGGRSGGGRFGGEGRSG